MSPRRPATVALVLLGVGGVGSALLRLLATPAAGSVRLVGIADSSRQCVDPAGLAPAQARSRLQAASDVRDEAALFAALDAGGATRRVIVDASASDALAARHATWLAAGYDVVSANKAALGGSARDCLALWRATAQGATRYGDSATVGAGLPVLSTLRRLRACGDRLLALEGVFSGSLSWLFNGYDGAMPFSGRLETARMLGYTEPDPRVDLAGADVARKLLILARCAGHALEPDDVQIENLVPPTLSRLDLPAFLAGAAALDDALEARRIQAVQSGCVLRHLARIDERGRASVGLVAVDATHPAARLQGTDTLFALTTTRYRAQPLVIQGTGAGTVVTAQALLGDVLAVAGIETLPMPEPVRRRALPARRQRALHPAAEWA